MERKPDGSAIKRAPSALPSLFDSSTFDEAVKVRIGLGDEPKPGAELVSPVTILSLHFPHILARITQFWGQETEMDDYLTRLVMMDRSDRAGFPKPIMDALLEIWNDHRDRHLKFSEGQCTWDSDSHLHKSFKKLDQEQAFTKAKALTGAEAAALDEALTHAANIQALQAAQDGPGNLHASAAPEPLPVPTDAHDRAPSSAG